MPTVNLTARQADYLTHLLRSERRLWGLSMAGAKTPEGYAWGAERQELIDGILDALVHARVG